MSVSTDLTDVTLVSEDRYKRLYLCDPDYHEDHEDQDDHDNHDDHDDHDDNDDHGGHDDHDELSKV